MSKFESSQKKNAGPCCLIPGNITARLNLLIVFEKGLDYF